MRLNERFEAVLSKLDKNKLIEIIVTVCEEETKEKLMAIFEKYEK
jgi:hypothetical protein